MLIIQLQILRNFKYQEKDKLFPFHQRILHGLDVLLLRMKVISLRSEKTEFISMEEKLQNIRFL